jgi:hypothetical protein
MAFEGHPEVWKAETTKAQKPAWKHEKFVQLYPPSTVQRRELYEI